MIGKCLHPGSRFRLKLVRFSVALMFAEAAIAMPALACRENAMLVFDGSGSMKAFRDGRSKIGIARRAAAEVLPDITRYRPTGLVTYGGGGEPACADIRLRVVPQLRSGPRIVGELEKIRPEGATPLTDAVRFAVDTLNGLGAPGVVVVITDGLENCGRSTCRFARKLAEQRGNIRIHVISFHLRDWRIGKLKCLTDATQGTYITANSLERLREALRKLLECVSVSRLETVIGERGDARAHAMSVAAE